MPETRYSKPVDLPYLRLRFVLETSAGSPVKFLIQLEYNLQMMSEFPDTWQAFARFDHNPESKKGHDIEQEGLHMDRIDADGTRYDVKRGFDSIQLDNAPEYCEEYLLEKAEILAEQFERRNGIRGQYASN